MLVFALILSVALLKLSVKGIVDHIIEPEINHEFSDVDFNRSKMFSAMSPYHMEEECKPVKIWILSRHGSKSPAQEILSKIEDELIPHVQKAVTEIYQIKGDESSLKYDDRLQHNQKLIIRSIIKWENHLNQASHKDLNERGKNFMVEFGRRLKEQFLPLVDTLKKDNVEIFSAKEWRCVLSGKKFLSSFFKGDHDDIDVKRSDKDDRLELIKPSDSDVEINDPDIPGEKILVEKLFFRQNCNTVTWKIKKMLFPDYIEGYNEYRDKITDDLVFIMYHACVHGYYFLDDKGKKLDVWCWLFTYDDLRLFEDLQDLQYYHKNGYYLEKNVKMGNPIANDLLHFLESTSKIKFRMFLAHTSNCLSLITRFNLFRDSEHLTVDNIKRKVDRKWKTSTIAPFGCNIMVVVYDCGYLTFKATIFVNESPIKMVLGNGKKCIKCPLEEVIRFIKDFHTEERLPPTASVVENEKKAIMKKRKLEEMKKQKEDKQQKKIKEENTKRIEEVFYEKEEYWDDGE